MITAIFQFAKTNTLLFIAALLIVGGPSAFAAKPANPDDINATLNYTIDTLKSEKYSDVYHHLLSPEKKRDIVKNGGMKKWAKEFAAKQAPKLLEMLKYIRKRNPYINPNNVQSGKAVFVFDKPDSEFGVVRFNKDKGRWYLSSP